MLCHTLGCKHGCLAAQFKCQHRLTGFLSPLSNVWQRSSNYSDRSSFYPWANKLWQVGSVHSTHCPPPSLIRRDGSSMKMMAEEMTGSSGTCYSKNVSSG